MSGRLSRPVSIRPMNRALMLTAAMVLAVLAAALHVLIFYMESIAWEGPLARKTFGGTPEEARPHAFYAFNQGFYNLFLALQALAGVALAALGHVALGAALILAGTGAMLAAAAPQRQEKWTGRIAVVLAAGIALFLPGRQIERLEHLALWANLWSGLVMPILLGTWIKVHKSG